MYNNNKVCSVVIQCRISCHSNKIWSIQLLQRQDLIMEYSTQLLWNSVYDIAIIIKLRIPLCNGKLHCKIKHQGICPSFYLPQMVRVRYNCFVIMIKNTEKYSYKLIYSGRLQQIKMSRNTFRDWDSIVSMGKLFQPWIDLK